MSETRSTLPRPGVDEDTAPFWAACKEHRLILQTCTQCGHVRYPPRPVCPSCGSLEAEWIPSAGRGFIYSWVVVYHAAHPATMTSVPYNLVLVEIEEGVRMVSNLVGIESTDITPGLEVEVIFDDVSPEVTLPKFRVRA
jgi:uncharacterized OB-fold protein